MHLAVMVGKVATATRAFYPEKCELEASIAFCFEWAGYIGVKCVTGASQCCRVHRTACPTNTPVWTVRFEDFAVCWTRGGGAGRVTEIGGGVAWSPVRTPAAARKALGARLQPCGPPETFAFAGDAPHGTSDARQPPSSWRQAGSTANAGDPHPDRDGGRLAGCPSDTPSDPCPRTGPGSVAAVTYTRGLGWPEAG